MEFVQTALEALLYSLVFVVAVSFVGFGVCSLLLPSEWRRYQLLLTPLLGWCVLVLALFAVNLLVGVQVGVYLVLGLALVVNLIALRARRPQDFDWREAIPPALLGLGLVVLALAPHIAQRSLGFILLNQDEEIYYPVANYLLTFPSTQDTHLMSAPFERWRPWGWGFQYTVAAVSALAGAPTFQTFLPTVYLLLGLSVLAWQVLLREVFGLTRNETTVVLVFYSLLGLPLWFGSYGYGPQIASLVAAPLATALFVASVEKGGRSRIALAGVAVAAGLVSFYRGIGLQYLFLFLPVFAVALCQSRSARPVARALAVAAVALAVGLPAHWDAGQYYFVQGAILSPDRLDMTGGWGLDYFQPPSVMLGLDAFPIAVDEEGTGPLAWLALPLGAVAEPFSWLVLILATLGSVWYSRLRPMALAVVLGSVISLSLNRFVLNFPYGYVKLMPMVAPLVFALFVVSLRTILALAKSAPDTQNPALGNGGGFHAAVDTRSAPGVHQLRSGLVKCGGLGPVHPRVGTRKYPPCKGESTFRSQAVCLGEVRLSGSGRPAQDSPAYAGNAHRAGTADRVGSEGALHCPDRTTCLGRLCLAWRGSHLL